DSSITTPQYRTHKKPHGGRLKSAHDQSWSTFCKKIQGTHDIRHDSSE
ncbi:unnamed protein product, partial [Ascophyllum nodosum]